MGIFGKSAAQKRIDELAAENATLRERRAELLEENALLKSDHAWERDLARTKGQLAHELVKQNDELTAALREIAAMETASSAHIGRKMAARARRELPPKQGSDPVRKVMEAAREAV